MKVITKIIFLLAMVFVTISCSKKSDKKQDSDSEKKTDSTVISNNNGESDSMEGKVDSIAQEILAQQEVTVSANASKIYEKLCTNCHGTDGTLGKFGATNLASSTMTLNDRVDIITNGKGIMIAYGDQLTKEEIQSLAFYLTNLRR